MPRIPTEDDSVCDPPRVLIVLELEAAPRIIAEWAGDECSERMRLWIRSHAELGEIVRAAVDARRAWEAKAA